MKPKRFGTPIFVFEDYVDFLKAWYSYARRFGFTQKDFREKAHINAKAFFPDVIAQRKKIGEKHIKGFVDALKLSPDEADYFSLLVHKKNARDPGEITAIGGKLACLRAKKTSAILAGGGTDFPNTLTVAGVLTSSDGTPSPHAKVQLIPETFNPVTDRVPPRSLWRTRPIPLECTVFLLPIPAYTPFRRSSMPKDTVIAMRRAIL